VQKQDYLERLIAQFAEAIGRALGVAKSGQTNEAQAELDGLWTRSLGLRRSDADRLDLSTLRALLGAKCMPASMILDAEADIRESAGDAATATRIRALASALRAGAPSA
jgi:hypothetical protein